MKLASLALVALATACSDSKLDFRLELTRPMVARGGGPIEEGIVGGQRHDGSPEVPLIGLLGPGNEIVSTCSGTLVEPRVVLTAAHCIDGAVDPGELVVYFGTDFTTTDPGFRFLTHAESIAIHPDWDPADVTAGSDIGILQLVDEVPIAPARIRTRPLTDAEVGLPIRLVGWGRTRSDRKDAGIKRGARSRLGRFDDLLVQVGNPATNTCNGDSGGPAFLTVDGVQEVIGITSFGDDTCTEQGLSTRVDAFARFITGVDELGEDDAGDGGDGDDSAGGMPLPDRGLEPGGCGAADRGRLSPLLVALLALLTLPLRRRHRARRPLHPTA